MTALIHEYDGALDPANIAIICRLDTIGRIHFRRRDLTSRAASRFAKIRTLFLKGRLSALSPPVHAALSLILLDGIATKADLYGALASRDQMYRWHEHICLDWLDTDGRQNRRHIGLITQAIFALPKAAAMDVDTTLQALDVFLSGVVSSPNRAYTLELLLLDAQSWLYERLPLPLFAHCIGKAPITALARSTLARHESTLALSPLLEPDSEEPSTPAFASAIGGYFALHRENQGDWFIDELVTICRRNRSLCNTKDKRRMLRGCELLVSRDVDIPALGGLILAWVIDLLQSGTRTKRNLKAITPAMYVGSAAKRLWNAFRRKDIEGLGTNDFLKIYQDMMDGLSSSQKRMLASALSSWHFFLTCWFDVPPLYRSLHRWVPTVGPKANIVWPHELATIRTWLAEPIPDLRHQEQLRVAFEIACQIRIRANELLNLRLQNIHCEKEFVTIEIATKAVDGGVKTLAAFRRDDAKSAECVTLIKTWYQRRLSEGAFPSDYLFGDPHRPDVKYAPGLLYTDLNRLFKAATGDPAIALHALSHTRISMDWLDAAFEHPIADINPFERESIDAGHASAVTGFASYFHMPEEWLRLCLDEEIRKHFSSWSCVSPWAAKSPDAYRQARRRARRLEPTLTGESFAARVIGKACPVLLLPSSSDGIVLGEAINPIAPAPCKPLTLSRTLDILSDIAFGHSAEAIASRSNRSSKEIGDLGRVALEVLRGIGEIDPREVLPPAHLAAVALQACFQSGISKRIQFQRLGQPKVGHLYDIIASGRQAEIVISGIEAWERCYQSGYLSIASPGAAFPFVALLDAADFPRSAIFIRSVDTLKLPLMAAFRTGRPGSPRWESIRPRAGRPSAYLAMASHSIGQVNGQLVGNAGLGMGGVNALMFASAVLRRMSFLALELKNNVKE